MSYSRMNSGRFNKSSNTVANTTPENGAGDETTQKDAPIKVDGFGQVLEMLKAADPEFRESLLRRIAQRDRRLSENLREQI